MKKQIIQTNQAPAPVGPYNQAILANGTLYISGQIAIDPATNELLKGSVEEETKQVMENLHAILVKAGFTFEHVVKCSIFITDMANFTKVNEVYSSYFDENTAPARETVAVAALPKGVQVEISAIAVAE